MHDPQVMLDFMFEKASRRKIELYTSGSYRSVWHLLTDERFRNKMNTRDRYFDGLATEAELDSAIRAADDVPHQAVLNAWDSITPQCQSLPPFMSTRAASRSAFARSPAPGTL
jgi:hypothetical protein